MAQFVQDSEGNKYRVTIATTKPRIAAVKSSRARCVLENDKLLICWNTAYDIKQLGLTHA